MTTTEYLSETAKYRHLTEQFCKGCGVDIGSQGDPVVPWAMNFELPEEKFAWYNSNNKPRGPIQLSGDARSLPFNNESLDFVYSSHLLEDFFEWTPVLKEWVRVLRPQGYLIVLVPDKTLWKAALDGGQTPNCEHRHESYAGELSTYASDLGLEVIEDRLTNCFDGDYSILFVGRKNY